MRLFGIATFSILILTAVGCSLFTDGGDISGTWWKSGYVTNISTIYTTNIDSKLVWVTNTKVIRYSIPTTNTSVYVFRSDGTFEATAVYGFNSFRISGLYWIYPWSREIRIEGTNTLGEVEAVQTSYFLASNMLILYRTTTDNSNGWVYSKQ